MTHDVTIERRRTDHGGARHLVRLDITELDSAGTESFDPTTEIDDTTKKAILRVNGAVVDAIHVIEQEDESLVFTYDTLDEEFSVKNLDDGTDVGNNTDVGEVLVEVIGGS